MNATQLRIGAVSYLNTKPLIYGLESRLAPSSLVFDLPSRLADKLHKRHLDLALIPTVEYLNQQSRYDIVSNACIACDGAVGSVRLLSRVPIEKIQTLACDEGSRTSIALTRILLAHHYNLRPKLIELPLQCSLDQVDADAMVIIGDRAMHDLPGFHETWDLGARWQQWTGLPFVFALWVVHKDIKDESIAGRLEASRDEGVKHFAEIARSEAEQHSLSIEDCILYFSKRLRFTLDSRALEGLALFKQQCERHQLQLTNNLVT